MREKFVKEVYGIADKCAHENQDKQYATHNTARDLLRLIDGEYSNEMPSFMMFAAPSKEFNQTQIAQGNAAWGNDIPLNRKAPTYGAEDSLVDAYDAYRSRCSQAARDMFK